MASFSDKLKEAQTASTVSPASYLLRKAVEIDEPSISIMTLDEPEIAVANEITSFAIEEWTKPQNAYLYDYYNDEYADDSISTVDKNKNITLSTEQINLTQEKNSQYIPFEMNRFYDGFDLATTELSFYWVNSKKYGGTALPVDVYYNSERIKFAWLIDSDVTAVSGQIEFEIHAEGTNSKGLGYLWKTKSNKGLNVIQALEIKTFIEPDESWQTSFVERLSEQADRAEASATAAQKIVDELQDGLDDEVNAVIADNYYTKDETHEYVAQEIEKVDVSGQLVDYALRSDIPVVPENVSAFTNDAGYLTEHQDISGKSDVGHTHTLNEITDYEEPDLSGFVLKEDLPSVEGLATEKYVQDEIEKIDVSGQLVDYAKTDYVDQKIGSLTLPSKEVETFNLEENTYDNVTDFVIAAMDSVDVSEQLESYYTKDTANNTFAAKSVENTVSSHTTEIRDINSSITAINEELLTIDKSPSVKYRAAYGEIELPDGSTAKNMFTFYKEENGVEEVQDRFQITGGGGTGSGFKTFGILNIEGYKSPLTYTISDKAIIKYEFVAEDSVGNTDIEATASWKIGNRIVLTQDVYTGIREADLTKYVTAGKNTFTLIITHATGQAATMNYTVQIVDLTISSDFNETVTYPIGSEVEFRFKPTGTVEKTVHFVLDGKEIGTKISSAAASGTDHYMLPAQEHGSHLLEAYITAEINGKTIGIEEIIDEETGEVIGYEHTIKVLKDITWFDPSSTIPVISCNTPVIEMTQYNSVNIKYCVFDPLTESPEVTWYLNNEVLSIANLTPDDKKDGYYTYTFKATEAGSFELKAICRNSEPKVITVNVSELDIDVVPVTSGLAFDFDISSPDYSNSSANRLWMDKNTGVKMTVSDNFDWVNGGYQLDEHGDKYFCVKAGTNAVIDYNLFGDASQTNGKEFKVVFRTKNIRKRDTSFLTCLNDGIGLDMKVEDASVYCSNGKLKSLYCEDEIIEYEFNINKSSDMMVMLTYEDGTPNIPYEYTDTTSFRQLTAQPITIGSEDCDIHIYRMKAYKNSLTEEEVKNNFIADARNAEDIIDRYTRNQIYNADGKIVSTTPDGGFNADAVMKSNPQLRYIFLEVPYFTNHKDNKVPGCSVYYRYPAGTRPEDNWDCTGVRHRGQGTSSNEYGKSGRNVDIEMNRDESLFTWTDENGEIVESSTITLTPTSHPTNYLNIKVNVASSENTNNSQIARRYNEFQPFLRYIRKKDSRVKDTMEFYNCVLFIRETNEDLSTHREFNDCNWHYYALGNVGDSKKTDDTRVNNPNDPREFVVELTDVDKPLSSFPTGKGNNETCPVSEWKVGNTAYDVLYSTDYVYDTEGKFKSFGGKTFEFRYEMDDITEEQREININVWRDFYKFLATSTDEEIYANLKKYFVVDSALYYYLFTERYTMVDNRAKNTFWHYGKVYISNAEAVELGAEEASYYIIDDEMAAFNDGYRLDLTFGYDFDTSLGIDNTGDLVFSYGKEDIDFYDDTNSKEVFRVSNSRFFCKIRDVFPRELAAMYVNREDAQAWNAESLITQWDNAQAQFPEEIWRLDYERKYKRPYLGVSVDNSIPMGEDKGYLIGKFFGRKKYQRRMYERNQEVYFATKYFANKARNTQIWFRGNIAPTGATIKQNYSLTITPYSDMYVCVQYTSTGTPIHERRKAGEPYTFINNATSMDFMYIFAADYIQEIGDLSRCYIDDNSFTNGIRLRKLAIGNAQEGYDNPYMTKLAADNNPLLEYIDLRNISGLNSDLVLTSCSNLKELYAEGTNATGAIFANGGLLEVAHLPAIKSLLMKNLNYIRDLQVAGYNNLETLTIENCLNVDSYDIVNATNDDILKTVRLVGINWILENNAILEKIYSKWGLDSANNPIDHSVLTGTVSLPTIMQYDKIKYQERWTTDLIINATEIKQVPVYFKNYDGEILDTQYVQEGHKPVDPVTSGRIDRPTKPSNAQYNYNYTGWDPATFANVAVGGTYIYTAQYESIIRKYTVKFVQPPAFNISEPLQETVDVEYGSFVSYEGETPTYTVPEDQGAFIFYLFDKWDDIGYVDGDKTITAIYDSCTYTSGYFNNLEIKDMRPVQLYMLTKLIMRGQISLSMNSDGSDYVGVEGTEINPYDEFSFTTGVDVDYESVESIDLFPNGARTFSGTVGDYYDTGIQLLNTDRSFVLAVDYEFASDNRTGATLMQCFQTGTSDGFKLHYSSNPVITWSNSTAIQCASGSNREMLVIRHKAGEKGAYVYISNLQGAETGYIDFSNAGLRLPIIDSNLVFGSNYESGEGYKNYAKGTIYWAKLWYDDLGESVCKDLASYIHEPVNTNLCGFRRNYLSGSNTNKATFSFLASNSLSSKRILDSNGANSGGWAEADLNTWLNTRFYNGLPTYMKQLIKQVKVKSTVGDKSTSTSESDCYIYIPALADISTDASADYMKEIEPGFPISYIIGNEDRIKHNNIGIEPVSYLTRSPNITGTYYYYVNNDGSVSGFSSSSTARNVVIMFSI